MSAAINIDELTAELQRLADEAVESDPGFTAQEIADAMGYSVKRVRQRVLRPLLNAGQLTRGERTIERIDGRPATVPVYRLTD